MNISMVDIERLADQLLVDPKFKHNKNEQEQKICKRLNEQLIQKKAVVKIQRMDAECLNLINNLQERLLFIGDVFSPSKHRDQIHQLNEDDNIMKKRFKVDDSFELDLSSDSSDNEPLGVMMAKTKAERATASSSKKPVKNSKEMETERMEKEHEIDWQQDTEPVENDVPLSLRRRPRERKSSYTSFSSTSSSLRYVTDNQFVSKKRERISHDKKESAVSTSGVTYHDEDVIVEEDCDRPYHFHVTIPDLFTRHVHALRLDSFKFGRKFIDNNVRQAKQQCLQLTQQRLECLPNSKKKKSRKNEKLLTSKHQENLLQRDAQFSQLIEDVMNETGNEETLQATKALENINNDIIDNYQPILSLSQSSHESQNSSSKNEESTKKRRKNSKRSNDQQPNVPAKKRGRKPKHKNILEFDVSTQPQPPTKSNLAKYVEYFANDCELLPHGSQTPAASSTMSQPLVSSTTQNFELIEQRQQQIQQHPITYFIDGDWANGGPCQLYQTTGMAIDAGQINQDALSVPFQDFVNYIDNNTTDTGNNVIARVLDNCNSLPIANMGFQNIFQPRQLQQLQPTQTLLSQPVFNIQIPSLPNNTKSPQPPMAHLHEEGVLDLTIKTIESNATITSNDVLNLNKNSNHILELSSSAIEEDNCMPLDLSMKNSSLYQNCTNTNNNNNNNHEDSQSQLSNVEIQNDDFIRRLIETSDFDLRPQELAKNCNNITTYDDGKSFKAALNMPLLEFDVQDLDEFVENSTAKMSDVGVGESDKLNDIVVDNDSKKCISNNDSNYVSMNESNSNILNSPLGNEIHFADQSTKEIFDKLLDILPSKNDSNLEYVGDKESTNSFVGLDESSFVHNNVLNSTMYETENVTNQKNSKEEAQNKCYIIQQIILNSADEKQKNKTNDNKPAVVQKFIPRILKRRNSLVKKTLLPNYQEKSNDDIAKIVENLNENLNDSVVPTETNITTTTLANDDCAKNLSADLVVHNDFNMKENKKDTKHSTLLVKDLNVKESSDISSKSNISLNEKNHGELKKDDIILMDKEEDLIAKEESNISQKETMKCANNESFRENLEKVKTNSNMSAETDYPNFEQTFNFSENENSISLVNECSTDILSAVATVEMDNTKQSTSLSNKKQSSTEAENLNIELLLESSTETDVLLHLEKFESDSLKKANKPIEISSSEKCAETEVPLNLEMPKSDSLELANYSSKKSTESDVPMYQTVVENLLDSSQILETSEIVKLNNPMNPKMVECYSFINSNNSKRSIQTNSPLKSTETDVPLNLEIPENDSLDNSNASIPMSSPEKFTATDISLNLDMSENNSLEKSNKSIQINSPDKSESDVSLNLEMSEMSDRSKHLKDVSIKTTLNSTQVLNEKRSHISNECTPNDIRSIPNENVAGFKTVADFNTAYSNEKVVFSISKISLSDDDSLLIDSDTISRKSFDDVRTHNDFELRMEESTLKNKSNYNEHIQAQSMDFQIGCSDHKDFLNMPQTDTMLLNETTASQNEPLCVKTEIQKKYYGQKFDSDLIDLSVKYDIDMEDNLIIDFNDTQSPKVVNSLIHDLIKKECNSTKIENTETPTTLQEIEDNFAPNKTASEDLTANNKMDNENIDDSSVVKLEENKQQASNFSSLKASGISHLTPLELDSKLEETLDFEEDFDDALSLATSCFDSPNDDRFEESFLDEGEQQTSITQITKNDTTPCIDNEVTEQTSKIAPFLLNSHNSQSSSNGLRNFKIPKITKSATTEKNTGIQRECQGLTPSSLKINISSGTPNITMKQAVVKLENITRTVKNELAATGSVNVIKLQQQQPTILTQSSAKHHIKINFKDKTELLPSTSVIDPQNIQALPLSDNLIKLFGITCQPYLVNKCYAITHCPLSHQLNDPDSVFQALSLLNTFDLSKAYRYVYNHSNMFKVYFIVFCNLFTLRKDRTKLLNMINDVERYPEYSQFKIAIYEAIVKCGFSRANACRQILRRSRERTPFNIDALVAIIMKSDWTMFTDYIEQYTEDIYKYNFCIGVLEQMVPAVLNSKGPLLKQVFGKCVQTLRCEDSGLLLNSPSLIQCVALLTNTT